MKDAEFGDIETSGPPPVFRHGRVAVAVARKLLRVFVEHRLFRPILTLLVIGLATTLAWDQMHRLRWQDIQSSMRVADKATLVSGFLLTLLALASMGLYDAFAFPAGRSNLRFIFRWLIGCFSFAWSNLLSIGGLAGPAIRMVLYRRAGLQTGEIAQGLGTYYFATSFGLAGWLLATLVPWPVHWDPVARLAAEAATALIMTLGIAFLFSHQLAPLLNRLLRAKFPDVDLHKAKLLRLGGVSFLEWGLTYQVFQTVVTATSGGEPVTYVPHSFFIGIVAGLVSGIPGGVGTADSVWLHLLSSHLDATQAAAAIVLFRGIFYLLPWFIAVIALYVYFLGQSQAVHDWHRRIVASTIAVGAVLLLISGALPAVPARITWMMKHTPLGWIETSHIISIVLAASLLYLVRGLLRGYRSAFLLTAAFLLASIVTNLLKGLDIEESLLAMAMFIILMLSSRHFSRKGAFSENWELVLAIFGGAIFVYLITGFTAFERIPYRPDLWTRFTPHGDASRFLRGLPILFVVGLFLAIKAATKAKNIKSYATETEILRAEQLICRVGESADPLLVGGGDKAVWFWSPQGMDQGLILYQRTANAIVIFKDPIIEKKQDRKEMMRDFMQFTHSMDVDPVFSMISIEWMDVLHDFGYRFIKFSQEAIVDLKTFSISGSERSGMRHTLNKCEKKGITFSVIQPPFSDEIIEGCRRVSDLWLEFKGRKEMQFSACYFSVPYLQRHPLGVARDQQGNIVAFINLLIVRDDGPATFDFMRYHPGIINSLMDYVVIKTALYCQSLGCTHFSLGGAALSNVGRERTSPLLEKLLYSYSLRAEQIYNYQGLYQYKAKFYPEWQPRYIAYRSVFDWGQALYACLRVVRPSREDMKRIARARTAVSYP